MSGAPSSVSQSATSSELAVDGLLSALSALLSAELQSSSTQYTLLADCNNIAAGKVRCTPDISDRASTLHAAGQLHSPPVSCCMAHAASTAG